MLWCLLQQLVILLLGWLATWQIKAQIKLKMLPRLLHSLISQQCSFATIYLLQ
jgi:hypothetical protein